MLSVLFLSGCVSSRRAVSSSEQRRVEGLELRAEWDSVTVEVHDTVMEVTTITIRENEQGDTIRVSTVTDRLRVKEREAFAKKEMKTEVVRDTVFIAKKDSIEIRSPTNNRQSALQDTLKWIFWVIVGLIGLTVILKIKF